EDPRRHPVGRVRTRVDRRDQRRPGELPAHARRAAEPPDRARGQGAALDDGLDRPGVLVANPYVKQYLMTAGPTPLPPAVSQVMAEPMMYHRAPAFIEIYARVLRRLKDVFQPRNEVQIFTSSGTGALESAVANLVKPGEPVLVASCGQFGERWFELCEAYGAETIHWEPEWGRKVDPAGLDERLAANPGTELVFTTFSETST